MQKLFYPILYAVTISASLPVIAGVVHFRRLRFDIKLLLILFAVVLITDSISLYCAARGIGMNWLHHIYSPLEYAIFGVVISTWQVRRFEKKAILFSIVAFALLCAWDIFGVGDWEHTNDFTASVSCGLFVGMTSYTLVGIERRHAGPIYRDYRFWMLIGLMVYSAGNIAFFAFFRHIVSYYLWAGHNALNIMANVCYTVGILCQAHWE